MTRCQDHVEVTLSCSWLGLQGHYPDDALLGPRGGYLVLCLMVRLQGKSSRNAGRYGAPGLECMGHIMGAKAEGTPLLIMIRLLVLYIFNRISN